MVLRRRTLLGRAAAAALALSARSLLPWPQRDPPPAVAAPLDGADWAAVRAQFALDPRYRHFATFLLAPHPAPVRQAVERYRQALDRDPALVLAGPGGDLEEAVRTGAARYLGVRPEEVALTDSTTMGLGLLCGGIRLRPGEEVVTTAHDLYATHEALRLRARRDGVAVRRITLYRDPATASVDEIVEAVRRGLGGRTRVLAVTWVHSSTGVKLPLRELGQVVAEANRDQARSLVARPGSGHQ